MAETINGSCKTELKKRFDPWECVEQLGFETARWIHWFNDKRISGCKPDPRTLAILEMLSGGYRTEEVCGFRWKSFDADGKMIMRIYTHAASENMKKANADLGESTFAAL